MTESFPRQQARTRRFSLGVPRAFTISPNGTRVVFLRTKSGADPVTCVLPPDGPFCPEVDSTRDDGVPVDRDPYRGGTTIILPARSLLLLRTP